MFMKDKKESNTDLALNRAYADLSLNNPDSDEYAVILDQIVKLHELQVAETPKPVSRDTLAMIAAQLAAVVIIVTYEHTHVITTKALGFVPKP